MAGRHGTSDAWTRGFLHPYVRKPKVVSITIARIRPSIAMPKKRK